MNETKYEIIETGGYTINVSKYHVSKDGERIKLTAKEFDLLLYLIGKHGVVATREEILGDIWRGSYKSVRVVDDTIRRIKKKMSGINIMPLYGVGYCYQEIVHMYEEIVHMGNATRKATTTYEELADRVGDAVLCNNVSSRLYETLHIHSGKNYRYYDADGEEVTAEEYQELEEQGESCYDEPVEIFQWYIISSAGARYLSKYTDEIVFYDKELDIYVWAITHWGTSWDMVAVDIKVL